MKKEYIPGVILFMIAILLVLANIAYAGGSHHHEHETIINNTIDNSGIASAIATAQHNFDYGTHSWQGSVGIGAFDTKTAFSFGLAKRFNKTLINGNITQEEGKFGGGIGINWHF